MLNLGPPSGKALHAIFNSVLYLAEVLPWKKKNNIVISANIKSFQIFTSKIEHLLQAKRPASLYCCN